jgi:hypothetical protein
MLASPDQQLSLTDPDNRSMATSGHGSGVVGYNVQVAVDTKHHLIVAHAVTNDGSDRAQLANIACPAKDALGVDELQAVADRGYFNGDEILARDKAGICPESGQRGEHVDLSTLCQNGLMHREARRHEYRRRSKDPAGHFDCGGSTLFSRIHRS